MAGKSAESSVANWVFAFTEEKHHRLVFSLPWRRLLVLALLLAAAGAAVLLTPLGERVHPSLRMAFGVVGLLAGAGLALAVLTSDATLTIDGLARVVRLQVQTPWSSTFWTKTFDEFRQVQFYQVVDRHGFHNHWRIELVLKDDSVIRLGYGLAGAVRRSSADELVRKISEVMGLPVEQLEKR